MKKTAVCLIFAFMLVLSANANLAKGGDGPMPLPVCPPQCPIDGQVGAN